MNTVRGFIFYIVLAITVIPVCFIVLILTPFTRAETRYGVMRAWGRFVIAALRVICGVRVQVKGMENCPKGPVVVLSKHQSAWETFWLGAISLPRRLCLQGVAQPHSVLRLGSLVLRAAVH